MVLKKGLVFIFSSILTSIIITVLFKFEGFLNFIYTFIFLIMYVAPMILVLGMPVSVFSDVILQNSQGKSRLGISFVIHIVFGLLIGLILNYSVGGINFLISSTIASFVVWSIDELLTIMFKKRNLI